MKDPRTVFAAFREGEIEFDALLSRLMRLLQQSPGLAKQILAQSELFYEQRCISDEQHISVKREINEFRRTHAAETELDEDAERADATVFAQEAQATPLDVEIGSEDNSIELEKTDRFVRPGNQTTDPDAPTQLMSEGGNDAMQTAGLSPGTKKDDFDFFISSASSSDNITTPVGQAEAADFHVGSIIKQRFKLEKVLGVGGMGNVYKALDLLKYEAKDKKPYVAVKLLNEDFKGHPEAFIALQRESSRQQKLAHPNIVTIYDFDRVGGAGTPVFITMEFMEGVEVKHFVKKKVLPQGGLPFEQAYKIIKQIGAGLIYAHERGLVHSDFKPGNTFICNDGSVKILDFGIARAVKNPVTGEAEKTLFDPGKLGALTPAYASLEMLVGQEPDTRDDIYALGCTAYELLTGRHPFNKLSADKAKNNGLTPPYIKKLNKKQNRALARAVAFERADRSPTVAHFLEELEGKATWHKNPFTIAAAALLLIAVIASGPTLNYLHQKRLDSMIREINAGDQQLIAVKLDQIRELKAADQSFVAEQAKGTLQTYFSNEIIMLIDAVAGNYDFPAAELVIKEIGEFYPGSIFLQEQMAFVAKLKKQLVSSLNTSYLATLEDKTKIDNIKDIMDKIMKIDPQHPLLTDLKAAITYRNFAREAFAEGAFSTALELIYSGLEIAPDDQRLLDLEARTINAQTVQQLELNLSEVKNQLVALPDFKQYEDKIEQLFRLRPDSALIALFSERIKPLFKQEMQAILASPKGREDANLFVANYQTLFNALKLDSELIQMQLTHLSGATRAQAVQEIAKQNINQAEQGLASPDIKDLVWETKLLTNINVLTDLTNEDLAIKAQLDYFLPRIAELYINEANKALGEKRFDVADRIIKRCHELFSIKSQQILDVRSAIAVARDNDVLQERIRINKVNLETFASGDSLAEALKIYQELKTDLPENDIYLTTEAVPMLSGIYARLAKSRADDTRDFKSAYLLVQKGLEIDPNNLELQGVKDEYEAEANIIELTRLFNDEAVLSFPSDIRIKVDQIQNFATTERAIAFREAAIKRLNERINNLKSSNRNAAIRIARSAAEIFPFSSVLAKFRDELQFAPWDQYTTASTLLSAGKLSKAQQIQQQAAAKYDGHPQFDSFSKTLEKKTTEAKNIFSIFVKDKDAAGQDYEQLKKARNLLARAQQLWTDSVDFAEAEKELEALIVRYKPRPRPRIRTVERDIGELARAVDAMKRVAWKPIASSAECTGRLAGHGLRSKAVCYDMVHDKARGPLMVVVPANDTNASFAFSKYEISVADWSKYCILSGVCQAIKDQDKSKPITGINLEQAKAYAVWLSKRTGKTYRLPTKKEWEYAARSEGKQPKKDFNCHIALGDKVIKGTGFVSVKSGKSNAWGIKNYVGNAQEWVTDEGAVKVRGGAFTDAHFKCDISLERIHDGSADEITGFRLIREEISE